MYDINDSTPIAVLTVGQFKGLVNEILDERIRQSTNTAATPQKGILNINELSEYTDLSKSHIYKLTSRFTIPHYKRGKRLYFKQEEIDEWLTENKVTTMKDVIEEASNFMLK